MVLRPDEDYVDTFERGWALAVGAGAFVAPWLVILTQASNDNHFMWGERIVWLLWTLTALLGVGCLIAGRRVRRFGRIGTAILVGDVLGALLFFVSLVALFVVLGFLFGGEDG
jgi:MFS family permease